MIYGKSYAEIPPDSDDYSAWARVHVTVTGSTTTIKQGDDLIRLSWEQTRALRQALKAGMIELETDPRNARR